MNFYFIFLRLCKSIGKSPSKVAVEIGSTRAAVNRWKNGSIPSDMTLLKLADYFGVTIGYLKGETDQKESLPIKQDEEALNNVNTIRVYAMNGDKSVDSIEVNEDNIEEISELVSIANQLPKEKVKALINAANAMK